MTTEQSTEQAKYRKQGDAVNARIMEAMTLSNYGTSAHRAGVERKIIRLQEELRQINVKVMSYYDK